MGAMVGFGPAHASPQSAAAFAFAQQQAAPQAIDMVSGFTPLSEEQTDETAGQALPIIVYGLIIGGRIAYVGRTLYPSVRSAAHMRSGRVHSGMQELGRSNTLQGARRLEQRMIQQHGTLTSTRPGNMRNEIRQGR
jgi:hypothetical protein